MTDDEFKALGAVEIPPSVHVLGGYFIPRSLTDDEMKRILRYLEEKYGLIASSSPATPPTT